MIRIIIILLSLATAALGVSYTEFYVQSGGDNRNSGSTTGSPITSTNGDWANASANRFTAASGTPFSTVSAGDFASIYADGENKAAYLARVTAVNGGGASIDLSATVNAGTAPAPAATGYSCRVGGPWAGPSGTESFPFGFMESDVKNTNNHAPRVNFKGDGDDTTVDYSITAAMTHYTDGPCIFSGYTTTPGDGGMVVFDGGASGTSYTLLTLLSEPAADSSNFTLMNFIFQNNGNSGSPLYGLHVNVGQVSVYRCVFRELYGSGVRFQGPGALVSCEAYACNKANTSLQGAIHLVASGANAFYCIAHSNVGTNASGFITGAASNILYCISAKNGSHGISLTSLDTVSIQQCDLYDNGGSGLSIAGAYDGILLVENSNFVGNGAWGINLNSNILGGAIANNGFGSGTQANTSGNISTARGIEVSGSVTYAADVTPWVAPDAGDFSISLAAAKNAGRGEFLVNGALGVTVGTPDIGAAFASDSEPPPSPSGTINATTTNAGTVTVQ